MFHIKRIYHPWNVWECYKTGFYEQKPPKGMDEEEAKQVYINFFNNLNLFNQTITKVFENWKYSCEHFLTNNSINRIAWLGQACVCLHSKVSFKFKSAFYLLSEQQQRLANNLAKKRIQEWEVRYAKKNKTLYQYMES